MNEMVKPGYRQTDMGVIPDDWSVCELGDLTPYVTSGSRGWAEYYSDRGDPFIRITNLSRSTIYIDQADLKFVKIPDGDGEGQRTSLINEDLLISITADIGIIGYVDSSLPKPAYINQHIALVRFKNQDVDSKYLSYFLAGEATQRLFRSSTDQGAKAGMNLAGIRAIKAVLPLIVEQHSISKALSEMDDLLSSLDQLIAKKRGIQQATMQQLLTGQRRLPGFSGKWHAVKARDIGLFRGGSGFPNRFQGETSGAFPFYKVSDMNNEGNEIFMSTANNYIAEDARKTIGAVIFPNNSIVFAKVGAAVFLERKKILTRPSCLDNNMAAFIVDERRVCVRFMHYALLNIRLGDLVSTTALPSLSNPVLSNIEIILPPVSEQQAIATTLSDIDAELATLEARRDKTRQLKQGMMQELLTGRIRLTHTYL